LRWRPAEEVNVLATAPVRQQLVRPDELARALDRRRHRLQVDLQSRQISTSGGPLRPDVAVLEIGARHLRVATNDEIPVGAVFEARVTMDDGRESRVRARVACSRRQPPDGHDGGYVSRFDFLY
jgi:hypothetical protein